MNQSSINSDITANNGQFAYINQYNEYPALSDC